jgi:hypothetical protein
LVIVASAVALSLSGAAHAVTVAVCPDSIAGTGTVRVISITVADSTPSSSCYASSDAASIPLTLAGYSLLDKYGATAVGELADGALSIVQTSTGVGTFSIASSLASSFENFILALKDGDNASPSIAYFSLGPGILSGSWTIEEWVDGVFNKYKGFSSAVLFGQACGPASGHDCATTPPNVPIPPAAILFVSGLAGLGLIGARRRRRRA